MKKLLAITVIFALVAGAAFAQVSASTEVRWDIARGQSGDGTDDKVYTQGGVEAGTVNFVGANDEGTYGGRFQFTLQSMGPTAMNSWEVGFGGIALDCAYAWWQPIPQIKFFLGRDGDGRYNTANLSRWGHHKMPRGVAVEDWDAGDYLLGNWDPFGMALEITPIDGLAINFAWKLPATTDPALEHSDSLKAIQLQATYNLDGVGQFWLTYQGEGAGNRIGLTFCTYSLVEGLAFEVGGNYNMTDDHQFPINIGVGVHFNMDAFGVKFRAFMTPDKGKVKNGADGFFFLKMDIMPFYALDFGTIFCNVRVVTNAGDKIGFHINPYLSINVGAGDFRIGFLIEDENGDEKMNWKLPVSMLVSF